MSQINKWIPYKKSVIYHKFSWVLLVELEICGNIWKLIKIIVVKLRYLQNFIHIYICIYVLNLKTQRVNDMNMDAWWIWDWISIFRIKLLNGWFKDRILGWKSRWKFSQGFRSDWRPISIYVSTGIKRLRCEKKNLDAWKSISTATHLIKSTMHQGSRCLKSTSSKPDISSSCFVGDQTMPPPVRRLTVQCNPVTMTAEVCLSSYSSSSLWIPLCNSITHYGQIVAGR